MVVHGASHLPVDLQSLQIELSLYSHLVEHLREDCQFVFAKSNAFVAVGTVGEQHVGFDVISPMRKMHTHTHSLYKYYDTGKTNTV